jgi:predicted acylesterase/phospholipase RssA
MKVLSLGGGAFKGAFQVPILERLVEENDYDLILGISVGAINAAFASQGDFIGLHKAWNKLDTKNPLAGVPGYFSFALHRFKGLWSLDPLYRKLKKDLSLQALQIPLGIGVVSRELRSYITLYSQDMLEDIELHKSIIASSAISGLMEPIQLKINGIAHTLCDGGHIHKLPLPSQEVEQLDVILSSVLKAEPQKTDDIISLPKAIAWLVEQQMYYTRLQDIRKIKMLCRNHGTKTRIFAPSIPTGNMLRADKEIIRFRMHLGQEAYQNPLSPNEINLG